VVIRDRATRRELQARFTITAPASPAPARSVIPTAGAPGTAFAVTAGGFTPGEKVGSWLVAPSGAALAATPYLVADGQGVVTWRWASPADAQAGVWQAVSAGRESRAQVAIPFTVIGSNPPLRTPQTAAGSVSPATGAPGATLTFTLAGFQGAEELYYWPAQPDGTPDTTPRTSITADGSGRALLEWEVPQRAQSGTWTMTFRGQYSEQVARVSFAVLAAPTGTGGASPQSGSPGATFTFELVGLNPVERLDTWLELPDGTSALGPQDARADRMGRAVWRWTAPAEALGGQWTMVARGQDTGRTARISFTVVGGGAPEVPASVAPSRGGGGTTFTFTATGFAKRERAGYWLNRPDGTIERFDRELGADGDGRITWTYTVPQDARPGIYVMVLRSSQNGRVGNDVSYALRFTVE
jgi:hypothetical protein